MFDLNIYYEDTNITTLEKEVPLAYRWGTLGVVAIHFIYAVIAEELIAKNQLVQRTIKMLRGKHLPKSKFKVSLLALISGVFFFSESNWSLNPVVLAGLEPRVNLLVLNTDAHLLFLDESRIHLLIICNQKKSSNFSYVYYFTYLLPAYHLLTKAYYLSERTVRLLPTVLYLLRTQETAITSYILPSCVFFSRNAVSKSTPLSD